MSSFILFTTYIYQIFFLNWKCQHGFTLIYCKNKGSLRMRSSPIVCNLHPCYAKVMLEMKWCSRRDPFSMQLKKNLDPTECHLIMLERIEENERSEAWVITFSLLARCSGALLSFMLCGLPSWLHPGTSQQNPVISSTLYVFVLSSRQCGKLFTSSPGIENDQL